mmetsp:Transcript_15157/g.12895  ORF Transcript_15157/g.12895 Transcript_15157/m.12895 type:complete len:592 (-) Transcript_15157:352-2127(-)
MDQKQGPFSVPVSEFNENAGETPAYRAAYSKELLRGFQKHPDIQTLQQMILKAFEKNAQHPYLGKRKVAEDGTLGEYEFKTFEQVLQEIKAAGAAMQALDIVPISKGPKGEEIKFVCTYAKNRSEWVQVDLMCCLYGYAGVALYDTLGEDAMKHIFDQTAATLTFCSGDKVDKLITGANTKAYESLKTIISFDDVSEEQRNLAKEYKLTLLTWNDLLEKGKGQEPKLPEIKPDDLFTLVYTSGTTALPKGVVITHRNLVSTVGGFIENPICQNFQPGDYYPSYLPLAHIFERMMSFTLCWCGVAVGFYSGNPLNLKDDLLALKPTFWIAVPRVLNRFYDAIHSQINHLPEEQKAGVEKAIAGKLALHRKTGAYTHPQLDEAVFNKFKAAIGGRVKLTISGGAPLSPEVGEFLRIAFCAPILEGYGLTETCAMSTIQQAEDWKPGCVGTVQPNVEIKLVDIPEMNYTSKDKGPDGEHLPRGEVCVRGDPIAVGYYKNEELTNDVFDKDGWYHTGDVGLFNTDGTLKIIDRKKNIFKLSQGEYVAPEKIEGVYLTNPYVSEIFVYGNSLETYLIAIVVPDATTIGKLAERSGI